MTIMKGKEMKTFCIGLLLSLICSIASAQYYSHPYVACDHDYGFEIALQQFQWDMAIYRDNLYRLYRTNQPNPYKIKYSNQISRPQFMPRYQPQSNLRIYGRRPSNELQRRN